MADGMEGIRHERFHIKTLDELREKIGDLGLDIPLGEDLSVLGEPLTLGGRTVPNRFAVHPMEGFDSGPDGAPGPLSFRRYLRYARGGFGLIWMEATAVLHEARSNPCQLFMHEKNVDVFARLVEETRAAARERYGHEIAMVLQLTHSGRYSRPDGIPAPIIAHRSPVLDPKHNLPADYPLVSDDYLDRLQNVFARAAKLAAQAGFDGVDIKSCHRYLLAELHASFTREGKYGGSFENRTRMLRETLARIAREEKGLFVTTRMNAFDAIRYPYGFGVDKEDYRVPDLAEPLRLVGELKELGVPLLNISIGNPYFNPHFGRPFDFPIKGSETPSEHPLEGIARFMGITRQLQKTYPGLPIIGSGYTWLRHLAPYAAAGAIGNGNATLFGIGRGAFAYPDTPRDVLTDGKMDPARCCVACSGCTQIMRDGIHTGCVVRDGEIYAEKYRLARRFAMDHLLEEARRCRDCEEPTCVRGCPAGVDVPAFVRAFADGDIAKSYQILRRANALPEMCAYVCPSEVQCEGACVEKAFCAKPIPIRDIQLVVCQIARRKGWTGVRLPSADSGRTAAIVGGGPAGLAAAIALLEQGHRVTMFDRGDKLGGTPDSLIPPDRYGNALTETEAILAPARKAGRLDIRFRCELGRDIAFADLRRDFDAVLLAPGLFGSSSLGQGEGVVDALAFLRQAKSDDLQSVPERVAVLGGGNTAMDAAVAARKLGARDVYLLYRRSFAEMPAWPAEREAFLESGGHALILTQPLGYVFDDAGKLTGVRIARTELGAPDESGRRRPQVVSGTESVLAANLAIEAIGQTLSQELADNLEGLAFTRGGLIETAAPDSSRTNLDNVFAAGDAVNGGTTAVRSVFEGMRAAQEMDAWLRAGGAKG